MVIIATISRCLEAENAMLLRRTCLMVDWENAAKAVEKVTTMTTTTITIIMIMIIIRLGRTGKRLPKLLARQQKQSFKPALKLPKGR